MMSRASPGAQPPLCAPAVPPPVYDHHPVLPPPAPAARDPPENYTLPSSPCPIHFIPACPPVPCLDYLAPPAHSAWPPPQARLPCAALSLGLPRRARDLSPAASPRPPCSIVSLISGQWAACNGSNPVGGQLPASPAPAQLGCRRRRCGQPPLFTQHHAGHGSTQASQFKICALHGPGANRGALQRAGCQPSGRFIDSSSWRRGR